MNEKTGKTENNMKSFRDLREETDKDSDIVVTIDGPSGSGKGTLAEFIAEKLELEHYSASDVFHRIADDRDISHVELSQKAEKEVDFEVDNRTLKLGMKENCVIDGRITSHVLGENSDLSIYLTAKPEDRARRISGRDGKKVEKALKDIRKRDRENSKRYQNYYGIDTDDFEIYDLIIDNTEKNIDEQNREVLGILKERFPERT